MKDADLKMFAREFAGGVCDKRGPVAMCYAVCSPLQQLLSLHGVSTTLVEYDVMQGEECWQHWCLMLSDGRILDPTAAQFERPSGKRMPEVYLGKRPTFYEDVMLSEFCYD